MQSDEIKINTAVIFELLSTLVFSKTPILVRLKIDYSKIAF